VCSNKIEILNVAGPGESKEPGVHDWTLNDVEVSESGGFRNGIHRKQLAGRYRTPASEGGEGKGGDRQLNFLLGQQPFCIRGRWFML
jgi:hypothetical protein